MSDEDRGGTSGWRGAQPNTVLTADAWDAHHYADATLAGPDRGLGAGARQPGVARSDAVQGGPGTVSPSVGSLVGTGSTSRPVRSRGAFLSCRAADECERCWNAGRGVPNSSAASS